MEYNLSYLIKTVKKYSKNKHMNNEDFVREFFSPYIQAGRVKNKYNTELELDKSRVSGIISRKDDVPISMRNALSVFDLKEKLIYNFSSFIEDYFDESKINICKEDICEVMNADKKINENIKKDLMQSNDFSEFLACAFIEAVKCSNKTKKCPTSNYGETAATRSA